MYTVEHLCEIGNRERQSESSACKEREPGEYNCGAVGVQEERGLPFFPQKNTEQAAKKEGGKLKRAEARVPKGKPITRNDV